jgi:hypothetical protein
MAQSFPHPQRGLHYLPTPQLRTLVERYQVLQGIICANYCQALIAGATAILHERNGGAE